MVERPQRSISPAMRSPTQRMAGRLGHVKPGRQVPYAGKFPGSHCPLKGNTLRYSPTQRLAMDMMQDAFRWFVQPIAHDPAVYALFRAQIMQIGRDVGFIPRAPTQPKRQANAALSQHRPA